ncbi:MAG: hypothetical protein AB7O66_05200 [Limisphaerales bacterium]
MTVLHAGRARSWSIERGANGGWVEANRGAIRDELTQFLDRKPWHPRWEARCLLPAGGVTLRRWKVPRSDEEGIRRAVSLQIESEFPLGPDELAWGWIPIGAGVPLQDVLVAAARRSTVAEISALLEECGLSPKFTLGALARARWLRTRRTEAAGEAWLHVGMDHSEWLATDALGPVRLRVLPWGEQTLVREWMTAAGGMSLDAALVALNRLVSESRPPEEALKPGWNAALAALVAAIPGPLPGGRLRVTGRLAAMPAFREELAARLGDGVAVESEERGGDPSVPCGIRRLQEEASGAGPMSELWLATDVHAAPNVLHQAEPRKWAMVAGALLLALLLVPYVEAVLFYPGLASRVAAVKSRQDRLEVIDRQVDFLRHLKLNQTPTLEALIVLGKTLPRGSKLDSLTLNQKGEMSLRVTLRQPPEVTTFRTQLTESGFFSSVVIEEQTPTPDRQKIQVRISAQVRPPNLRQGLPILAAEDATASKPGVSKGAGTRGGAPQPGPRPLTAIPPKG